MTPSSSATRTSTRWFGTLKARLALASALVIAASVAVSTLVVLERMQRRSEQAVMDLERDDVERMASLLGNRVVGMQRLLRAAATTLPAAARSDPEAAAAFLDASPALLAAFANVYVVDARGQILALHDGSAVSHPDLNVAAREYFRTAITQGVPMVSAPIVGRVSHEPVIQFGMPVPGPNGQPQAVLAGTLRLTTRNLLDDLTYGGSNGPEPSITIVTDAHGVIISHPRRERVMRAVAEEPGLATRVARWVAQGRPIEPSAEAAHEGGRFISMAGVPGADWMVFRLAPAEGLLGGLTQARREAVQWAAGVALVGSLLILQLLSWLLGPLSRLRQRALDLHDGTQSIDAGWPTVRGEIGELSDVLQQVLRERVGVERAQHMLVQQMRSVLAAAPIGIAFTRERRFELAGAEFCTLLGWSEDALLGRPAPEVLWSAEDYQMLGAGVRAAFAADRPCAGEMRFRRRDGSGFWGRLQGRPVDAADSGAGIIWLLEDVTERRQASERLSWLASHDALTQLLNRAAFEERLMTWLAQAEPGVPAAMLFIDLDGFKGVNDAAGHAAGDAVLRNVAALLRTRVRDSDFAARMGGDEFALLLPGCVAEVALQLAERLAGSVAQMGVEHGGARLRVGASIGVVEIDPAATVPPAEWLDRADAACYAAKRAGRGVVRLAQDAAPSAATSRG